MKYSFTKPKPKNIFKKLTKIWMMYIVLSVLLVVFIGFFLSLQTRILDKQIQSIEDIQVRHLAIVDRYNKHYDRLVYEIDLYNSLISRNSSLQEGILNLLNLVPPQITISYMKLENNQLILKGVTPSKQLYEFLMQKPLRSIFSNSYVNFFPLSSGWYNFISVSK